jgi:hypothetical protein
MKKMTKISTAIASLLLAGIANAATPGGYVGVGIGDSVLRTSNPFNTSHTSGLSTSSSRGGLGGRVFGGYNFNNYVGLEAAYATYANSTYKASVRGIPSANASVKYALDAFSLVGKGYLPIADTGLNAYALGGLAEVRNEVKASAGAFGQSASDRKNTNTLRPMFGVGVSYDMAEHVTSSLELSRIIGSGDTKTSASAIPNADMVTLNLGYNFG